MTSRRPFTIGPYRTDLLTPPDDFVEEFSRNRAIVCAEIFEPAFLETLMGMCRRGDFVADEVVGLGHREVEKPSRAGAAITLALKRPALTEWLESATDCGPLVGVDGRVVQARANNRDELTWHNDLHGPRRRLAITINLTEEAYEGGQFELRECQTHKMLTRHHHVEPGMALIFDVAKDIEHRVLPVSKGGPRRVYTGWFFKEKM